MTDLLPFTCSILALGYFCKLGWMLTTDFFRSRNARAQHLTVEPLYTSEDYFVLPFTWPADLWAFLRSILRSIL